MFLGAAELNSGIGFMISVFSTGDVVMMHTAACINAQQKSSMAVSEALTNNSLYLSPLTSSYGES